MSTRKLRFVGVILSLALSAQAQQRVSDDRDLTDFNLTGWNCLNSPEGTAKTKDGQERNRLKNRAAKEVTDQKIPDFDTAEFLKHVAVFDQPAKGKRREDVVGPQKTQLDALEKEVASFTGYLVLAYAGPPETTNCGSVDFHDWHLEVFEKPADHAPRIGDPTPVICEITPRTQKAIYAAGIRLRDIAGFIRRPDMTYEPTGHRPKKVRLTGYLLWDDDHNGSADIGTKIESVANNGLHRPWRSTAFEMHPVVKVEVLDGEPSAEPEPTPSATASPSATPIVMVAPPTPAPQIVVILEPVKIKIPYGGTVLPRGLQLKLLARDAQSVTVRYMETTVRLPLRSVEVR